MVEYKSTQKIVNCPECGGAPSIFHEQWCNAFSARCSFCGWEGDTKDVSTLPLSALDMWNEKAYKNNF